MRDRAAIERALARCVADQDRADAISRGLKDRDDISDDEREEIDHECMIRSIAAEVKIHMLLREWDEHPETIAEERNVAVAAVRLAGAKRELQRCAPEALVHTSRNLSVAQYEASEALERWEPVDPARVN